MDKFRKPHGSGDNKEGGRFDDRRPRFGTGRPPQLFPAICSECGKACQLPFRPNGQKPVYCNDCFSRNKAKAPAAAGNFTPKTFQPAPASNSQPARDNRIDEIKKQLDAVQSKLDSILQAVSTPKRTEPKKKAAPKKKAGKK